MTAEEQLQAALARVVELEWVLKLAKEELDSFGISTASDPVYMQALASTPSDSLKRWQEMDRKAKALAVAVVGLNKVASWSEGDIVDSSFDEPCAAAIARNTIREVESAMKGNE